MQQFSDALMADFPEFYGNPFIKYISTERRWTVSDNNKRPMHLGALLTSHELIGTRHDDPSGLLTLHGLSQALPAAANASFYLDSYQDQVLILDIEAECPTDLRNVLLTLIPKAFYAEVSRSGKGYHLVLPLPRNFHTFENARNKLKIQHHNRYFEILIQHWISFTRIPIPDDILQQAAAAPLIDWDDLYAHLASTVKQHKTLQGAHFYAAELPPIEDIPHHEEAIAWILRYEYSKDLNDFGGDTSRWEFGVIHHLIRSLNRWKKRYAYSPEQIVTLIYYATLESVPHREKHDTFRDGNPFLLSQVQKALELSSEE